MNGLAQYVNFNPCPYPEIVDAFNSIPQSDIPQPIMQDSPCCCQQGLGAFMDGTGLLGTGLFVGGFDPTTWGVGEYAVLAVGAFALYSMFDTGRRGARRIGARAKKIKRGFTS